MKPYFQHNFDVLTTTAFVSTSTYSGLVETLGLRYLVIFRTFFTKQNTILLLRLITFVAK